MNPEESKAIHNLELKRIGLKQLFTLEDSLREDIPYLLEQDRISEGVQTAIQDNYELTQKVIGNMLDDELVQYQWKIVEGLYKKLDDVFKKDEIK